MFQLARPLFLTCETPLHAGSGDALGIVDLPIQRERHTSFPKIEASSLKGALRESFEEKLKKDNPQLLKAFGPEETGGDSISAGALGFTDARLLLFPVKSMKGVFAWITCPKVLRQFSSDLKLSVGLEVTGVANISDGSAVPLSNSNSLAFGGHFVLEEYTFTRDNGTAPQIKGAPIADWLSDNLFIVDSFWHEKAKNDILILSDNDFKDFVNLSTEVITRTKIDNETGTVQRGALFTEEYLPAESVLYSLVLASPEFVNEKEKKNGTNRSEKADNILKFFTDNLNPVVQLGGNATLGKGLLRTTIVSPSNTENNG